MLQIGKFPTPTASTHQEAFGARSDPTWFCSQFYIIQCEPIQDKSQNNTFVKGQVRVFTIRRPSGPTHPPSRETEEVCPLGGGREAAGGWTAVADVRFERSENKKSPRLSSDNQGL